MDSETPRIGLLPFDAEKTLVSDRKTPRVGLLSFNAKKTSVLESKDTITLRNPKLTLVVESGISTSTCPSSNLCGVEGLEGWDPETGGTGF